MKPNKKMPLFIITGASGVGKSTISQMLFEKEDKYIVLESDLLWNNIYNTPDDDYHAYRKLWLRICSNISQIGMPVVLCGCVVPKQFEFHDERKLFSEIYYIAIASDEETLVSRMKNGRKIQDENRIKSSIDFNNWLRENADKITPQMDVLDYPNITLEDAANKVNAWICERI